MVILPFRNDSINLINNLNINNSPKNESGSGNSSFLKNISGTLVPASMGALDFSPWTLDGLQYSQIPINFIIKLVNSDNNLSISILDIACRSQGIRYLDSLNSYTGIKISSSLQPLIVSPDEQEDEQFPFLLKPLESLYIRVSTELISLEKLFFKPRYYKLPEKTPLEIVQLMNNFTINISTHRGKLSIIGHNLPLNIKT